MTKADIITKIARKNLVEETVVSQIVDSFMATVKDSLGNNQNVYLREFGGFLIKHRAEKHALDIPRKTRIIIPAHNVPVFKPADSFKNRIKASLPE